MAGHIVLGVAYGIEPSGGYLRAVFHAVEALNLGLSPIALLHDMFPICECRSSPIVEPRE